MQIDYLYYLPNGLRDQAIQLYLHTLRDKLEPILGTDGRAQKAMKRNLVPDRCIVAVCKHQLVGILGIQTNQGSFLNPTLKTMIKTYGLPGGSLRMCGLALLHHSTAPDEIYVDGVAVLNDMRGNGIGSRLLDMAEAMALKKGIRTISLEVIDTNPRAEALYRRLGYIIKKRRTLWPLSSFIKFPFKSASLMVKTIG